MGPSPEARYDATHDGTAGIVFVGAYSFVGGLGAGAGPSHGLGPSA